MNPKITIITPSFNRAHTLERVYNSIVNQSFKNLKWLIVDDGSIDDTKELIQELQAKNQLEIEYRYHTNRKKFCTLLDGILNHVQTDYFIIMDSDDEFYGQESIAFFYREIAKIKNNAEIASVVGNTIDSEGKAVGTGFPVSPLDSHIFEMRHKHMVKGGKMSINDTRKFKLLNYNMEFYCGKGYVPDDVWQNIFDSHYKSRFINEIFKIYHLDENDKFSLTSGRYTKKNAFGIMESYRTAVNNYQNRFWRYPVVILKKMFGYIYYGLNFKFSIHFLYNRLNGSLNKVNFILLFFPGLIYYYLRPLKQ